MTPALLEFMGIAQKQIILAAIVFLRVGAAMALLPGFGERTIPARIRLVMAFSFTAVVSPVVSPSLQDLIENQPNPMLLLICETMIGLALGFVLRLFVLVLEMAGTLAAQSSSLSQMFGGAGEPAPAFAHLLVNGGLALAMMSGLHIRIVSALVLSYDILPAGAFPNVSLMRNWGVGQISSAFAMGFSLAAPFVIGALIYNVALGVINRAMPALMVTFIGAPALTAGALILLSITAPLVLGVWNRGFESVLANPFTVPR